MTVGTVTLSGADAANYTVGPANNPTANITALALVGSVTVSDKVFDGNTSATIATRSLATVLGPMMLPSLVAPPRLSMR